MAIRTTRARRVAVVCAVAVVTLIVFSGVALSQNSDENPKWDVFAGYQWFHPGGTVPAANSDPSNPTPFIIPDMDKGVGGALALSLIHI